jgi:hypothetical protein
MNHNPSPKKQKQSDFELVGASKTDAYAVLLQDGCYSVAQLFNFDDYIYAEMTVNRRSVYVRLLPMHDTSNPNITWRKITALTKVFGSRLIWA